MASKRKISAVIPQFGNNRSHSLKATRRQFKPNYQSKRLWIPEMKQFLRVKVTASEDWLKCFLEEAGPYGEGSGLVHALDRPDRRM
jgi:ribosomal protein L28